MGDVIALPQRFSDALFTTEPQLHRWDQSRDVEDVGVLEPIDAAGGDRPTS